jgi:RNA polymerase sigma-70 factor (ECF subfamily)
MQDPNDARGRFNRLVSEYSQDVFRYAFWLCRDRTMAEELSQETFMRAWKSIDSLQDDKAAKSWLFTIVRRENARQYERKRLDTVDDPDFERVEAFRPEYDTSTEAFVLRRALEALPEEYREPLVLQVIGGYSTDEIADQLGIKAGAVMTRLFRARKKLREMLGERED